MNKTPNQSQQQSMSPTSKNEVNHFDESKFNSVMNDVQNIDQNHHELDSSVSLSEVEELTDLELSLDEVEDNDHLDVIVSTQILEQLLDEYGLEPGEEEEMLQKEELLVGLPADMITEDISIQNETSIDELNIDEQLLNDLFSQLEAILQQLRTLLQKGENSEEIKETSKALHQLLQLWGRLPKQMQESLKENELKLDENKPENDLLRNLISLFEKRDSFARQNVYQMNSSISQEDVRGWLEQSLNKHSLITDERQSVPVSNHQPMQMSQLQQYTLHVTESNRIDAISRNLVSDLTSIINKSNFIKQPGLEQLTLNLKPNSLGDVTIRLAQINGEMTVRFLVTTEAARKLFESNLHQLKPMFAPNQVVVERDLSISDEEFFHDEQETLEEEQEQKDNEHESEHEETGQAEVTFDELLHLLSEEAKH